jgi:thiol-disulfide isomerase/thioredoxin
MLIVGVVIAALAVGGGALAYNNNQNDKKEAEKMAMEKKAMEKKTEDEAMMKKEESAAMEKDKMAKDSDAMEKKDTMSKHGTYVTRADYDADPSKYADTKKVYFFHASWCPICQGIHKEIEADGSKIPAGVTLIKTDFDSATDLRQKYGVTTQYTFVQVDSSGNESSQWSATTLDKAIAGISG